ncbi:ATP-dependent helicase [Clostridium botulinum]|nr:ATP-dependent helicase [Clostridium botulinum]
MIILSILLMQLIMLRLLKVRIRVMSNISDYIEVTEEDISYAEKILFGKTRVFDYNERIIIIKDFNDSFDINACPGSGKTTVLLAKLIILSRKMPFRNGQGICVLTHTNVAIDEIKNKLGQKSEILFKYPNYFGTIQSFIDKYLTIPFYKYMTGENIKSIDDDMYYSHLHKLVLDKYPNIKNAVSFCVEKNLGSYREGQHLDNFIKFILSKNFKVINNEMFICNKSGATLENKKYYKELLEIMYDGVLRYNDAYIFADAYLSKFPNVSTYISKRFKYVFIDEMQDTNIVQAKILDRIFEANEGVVVQRFGDINQRIGLSREESGWDLLENTKYINSTKRYGKEMIKFLKPLRILDTNEMRGNEEVKTLSPHILIFNDGSIKKVIDKFLEVIKKYGIDELDGKVKVIGKIGREVESPNLSIKSYTDFYTKNNKNKSINKECYNLLSCKKLRDFYEDILLMIVSVLRYNNKKVSKSEFIKYMQMEKDNEFILYKAKIKNWFYNIGIDTSGVLKDIKETTSNLLNNLEKYVYDELIIEEKFTIPIEEELAKEQVASAKQVSKDCRIDDINTVFGVKGETHLATLYLESKLIDRDGEDRRSDIIKILDYMVGKNIVPNPEDEEALIAAYVAMSRAQKLTCIAISYETIQGRIKEFEEYGYEIIPCDKEIEKLIEKEM